MNRDIFLSHSTNCNGGKFKNLKNRKSAMLNLCSSLLSLLCWLDIGKIFRPSDWNRCHQLEMMSALWNIDLLKKQSLWPWNGLHVQPQCLCILWHLNDAQLVLAQCAPRNQCRFHDTATMNPCYDIIIICNLSMMQWKWSFVRPWPGLMIMCPLQLYLLIDRNGTWHGLLLL